MEATYASRYRTLWERHWWWRSRETWILAWIRGLNRRQRLGRILDVGCGDGLFFDRLRRFGHVEGLEPDRGLIADTRWRDRIRAEPLDRRFRADHAFDLVLMLDVLEHIEDDREALAAARDALRPGGTLLLTVPALQRLWSRHDVANQHYRRYHRSDLAALLESAGFEVVTLRYFFLWTVAPLLLRRWLAPARASGTADYEVAIPPRSINWSLNIASQVEHTVGRLIPWPVGSSLLAIARKREDPELGRGLRPAPHLVGETHTNARDSNFRRSR